MRQVDIWTCDLCNHREKTPIPELPGSVVCQSCGFVYVPERRSAAEIAAAWDDLWSEAYTSTWPGVIARLTYVAEFCDQTFGWEKKRVLDIGAGEGTFVTEISLRGARAEGLDPSFENYQKIGRQNILSGPTIIAHHGTAESFNSEADYDVVTLLWTLENTGDCMAVLRQARKFLRPNGIIVVATGSRILVPFKKPFSTYRSDLPPDLHCYRWSANSLQEALSMAGFGDFILNDFEQNDSMVVIGRVGAVESVDKDFEDDPAQVLRYLKSWAEQFP